MNLESIAKAYARRIIRGEISVEEVPGAIRELVESLMVGSENR